MNLSTKLMGLLLEKEQDSKACPGNLVARLLPGKAAH